MLVSKLEAGTLGGSHHGQYDSGVIVPKLAHNPHSGKDSKEEEDKNDYEESDGEG